MRLCINKRFGNFGSPDGISSEKKLFMPSANVQVPFFPLKPRSARAALHIRATLELVSYLSLSQSYGLC